MWSKKAKSSKRARSATDNIVTSARTLRKVLSEKEYRDAMVVSILGVFKEIRRTSGALLDDVEISTRIADRIIGDV